MPGGLLLLPHSHHDVSLDLLAVLVKDIPKEIMSNFQSNDRQIEKEKGCNLQLHYPSAKNVGGKKYMTRAWSSVTMTMKFCRTGIEIV